MLNMFTNYCWLFSFLFKYYIFASYQGNTNMDNKLSKWCINTINIWLYLLVVWLAVGCGSVEACQFERFQFQATRVTLACNYELSQNTAHTNYVWSKHVTEPWFPHWPFLCIFQLVKSYALVVCHSGCFSSWVSVSNLPGTERLKSSIMCRLPGHLRPGKWSGIYESDVGVQTFLLPKDQSINPMGTV